MAVYPRKGSPYLWIEFEFQGRRIRQSAGTSSRRKAEEFERTLRQQLHEQIYLNRPAQEEMTIREAVERYLITHLRTKKRRKKTAAADVFLLNKLINRISRDEILPTEPNTPLRSK